MEDFDVFISYSHQDRTTAIAACATMEAAGIRCWIAPRDIAPGAEWAASIVEAIDKCRAMVLIFSSHANRSSQVHREVQRAFDREAPVVPFRIEETNPERSLAFYMGPVHWLDALTMPIEQHLQRLAASVKALLQVKKPGIARDTAAAPAIAASTPPDPPRPIREDPPAKPGPAPDAGNDALGYLGNLFSMWTISGLLREDAETHRYLLSAFNSLLSSIGSPSPADAMQSWIARAKRQASEAMGLPKDSLGYLEFDVAGPYEALEVDESYFRLWKRASKTGEASNMAKVRLALIAQVGEQAQRELIGRWNERMGTT